MDSAGDSRRGALRGATRRDAALLYAARRGALRFARASFVGRRENRRTRTDQRRDDATTRRCDARGIRPTPTPLLIAPPSWQVATIFFSLRSRFRARASALRRVARSRRRHPDARAFARSLAKRAFPLADRPRERPENLSSKRRQFPAIFRAARMSLRARAAFLHAAENSSGYLTRRAASSEREGSGRRYAPRPHLKKSILNN